MSVRKFLKASLLTAFCSSLPMVVGSVMAEDYYILTPSTNGFGTVENQEPAPTVEQSVIRYQPEPRVYEQSQPVYQPQLTQTVSNANAIESSFQAEPVYYPQAQAPQANNRFFAPVAQSGYDLVSEINETPVLSNQIDLVSGQCTTCDQPYASCCCPDVCTTGCGDDCSIGCCDNECDTWKCILGVEATYFWVDSNSFNNRVRTFDTNDLPVGVHQATGTDDDGMYSAPRIWIGVEKDGWGIVGRWWDFEAGNVTYDYLFPFDDGTGFQTGSDFTTYYADLELTRAFCCNTCSGQISLGARHGQISSGSTYGFEGLIGDDIVRASTFEERDFEGTGMTFGFEGYKSIGCGVDLFLGARGSYLWGDAAATAAVFSYIDGPSGTSEGSQYATAGTTEGGMSVAELQAGVRWIHKLKCAPQTAFFRLAWEYQNWTGDNDVVAWATSTSFLDPGASINAYAEAGDQKVDLFGFSVSAGFTY